MPHLFFCPLYDGDPKVRCTKFCGIQYDMDKFELADLILRYLYQGKEQHEHFDCTDSKALAKELKNAKLPVVEEEQVDKAVKYLHERGFIKGTKGMGVGVLRFSITPAGEDLVDSKLSVQEVAHRAFEPFPTNTTTINGDVNQFAQGDNNKLIQNNHMETADDKFEKLMELLEQHGETKLADEAKTEKKTGGIRKALAFVTKKIADSCSTKAGQELVPLVIPAIAEITKALPPQ